jgi:hypothetical protein
MVKKLALASLALSTVAMTFVAPAAHAGPFENGPRGRLCGYNASSDPAPDADADAMTGQVNGGPLAWDRDFVLHCTLQVDSNVHNGTSNDTVHESIGAEPVSDTGNYLAILQPTPINYLSPEESQDYLCTSVTSGTTTLYWRPTTDGPDGLPNTPDDVPGAWTTDPNTPCSAATQVSTGVSTGPVIDLLNELVFEPLDVLVICPLLKILRPVIGAGPVTFIDSEGDLFLLGTTEDDLFWDCPVYVDDGDAALGGIFDA